MDQAGVTVPFAAKGFDEALARDIPRQFQATDNTPSRTKVEGAWV
jgi:hypothetical protein